MIARWLEDSDRIVTTLWVVYERPLDYPDGFVIRAHYVVRDTQGRTLTAVARVAHCVGPTLESVRRLLPPGLHPLGRMPNDEPQIVEVWI